MRVALVTTWGTACGIAEHAAYLKEAVEAADPNIFIVPITDLHPRLILEHGEEDWDLVVLNYQAALLSQWTRTALEELREHAVPTVVIYHDTGVPNSAQCQGICAAADVAIVHEPCEDLTGEIYYWRMGVPGWANPRAYDRSLNSWCGRRPILGTVGFPFPWKNFDELARVTRLNDWAFLVVGEVGAADRMRLEAINPHSSFTGWQHRIEVEKYLSGCDATAFCYTCANTGQSGAVLQGIAARKPVLAFSPRVCRQFRALYTDELGNEAIWWADSFREISQDLRRLALGHVDPGIVALAEQESWEHLGAKYADLFRRLVAA